jgi:hypothetical protein
MLQLCRSFDFVGLIVCSGLLPGGHAKAPLLELGRNRPRCVPVRRPHREADGMALLELIRD